MEKLSDTERFNFEQAIRRKPYDREMFNLTAFKLCIFVGMIPASQKLHIPVTLIGWRKSVKWSIGYIARHQAACDAAEQKYREVMANG